MAHTRLPRAAHLLQTKPRGQPRPPRSPGSRTCSAPLPLPARAGLPPASLSASVQPGQPETSAGRPQRTTQAGGAREGRGGPAGPAQRWGQQRLRPATAGRASFPSSRGASSKTNRIQGRITNLILFGEKKKSFKVFFQTSMKLN